MKNLFSIVILSLVMLCAGPGYSMASDDSHTPVDLHIDPGIQQLDSYVICHIPVSISEESTVEYSQTWREAKLAADPKAIPVYYASLANDDSITLPAPPESGSPLTAWIAWGVAILGAVVGYIVGRMQKKPDE